MKYIKAFMLITWGGLLIGFVLAMHGLYLSEKDYRALLETRTGEVLNEPMKGSTPTEWSTTGTEFAYHVNGATLVRVVRGVGPCKNDDPIAHHTVCIDGNTVYVIPPYTGWIDTSLTQEHLYMRNNQPCGVYVLDADMWAVALGSDTAPINEYRTEREARHAIEEGCR